MKVFTITLNPAFDIHLNMPKLEIYKENYASHFLKCAGGKGINISRALKSYGIENKALCVMGEENEAEFSHLLDYEKINYKKIITKGRIRENITIHDEKGETRISTRGESEDVLDTIYDIISSAKDEKIVAFTGKIPNGIKRARAIEFLIKINTDNTKLILDSNSFSIDDIKNIKPFLIKPNEQEAGELFGKNIKNLEQAKPFAEELSKTVSENVIISLGKQGFFFCGKDFGEYRVISPKITPVSTIGAGDSLIAGFISGVVLGKPIEKILSLSASFGSSACLTQGTTPPEKEMIQTLEKQIIIEKI